MLSIGNPTLVFYEQNIKTSFPGNSQGELPLFIDSGIARSIRSSVPETRNREDSRIRRVDYIVPRPVGSRHNPLAFTCNIRGIVLLHRIHHRNIVQTMPDTYDIHYDNGSIRNTRQRRLRHKGDGTDVPNAIRRVVRFGAGQILGRCDDTQGHDIRKTVRHA